MWHWVCYNTFEIKLLFIYFISIDIDILWLSWISVCSSFKKWAMFWSSWDRLVPSNETATVRLGTTAEALNHFVTLFLIYDVASQPSFCELPFFITYISYNASPDHGLTKSNIFYLLWNCACVCVTQLLFSLSKYYASNPNICTSHFNL